MNKAQKILILVGIIILIFIFGQTIYKTGFDVMKGLIRLPLKIIVLVVVILLIFSFLKKLGKKN
jgi:hypothetical protein